MRVRRTPAGWARLKAAAKAGSRYDQVRRLAGFAECYGPVGLYRLFRLLRIRGFRMSPEYCPVSRYLSRKFDVENAAAVRGLGIAVATPGHGLVIEIAGLPENDVSKRTDCRVFVGPVTGLFRFVEMFDSGHFPELGTGTLGAS